MSLHELKIVYQMKNQPKYYVKYFYNPHCLLHINALLIGTMNS